MKKSYLVVLVILLIVPLAVLISAFTPPEGYINYNNINTDSLAINNKFIQLKDDESHKIEYDFISKVDGFGKTSIFGFSSKEFADKPFLIRSYEQHDSEFELLTNYSADNFIEQLFQPTEVINGQVNYLFNNYADIHSNSSNSPFSENDIADYNYWRTKLGHDPDSFWWPNIKRFGKNEEDIDILVKTFGGGHSNFIGQQSWPLEFFHDLIKEKVARDIIVEYIISSYKNTENKIPLSVKKEFLALLNNLLTFLEEEITKIKVNYDDPYGPDIDQSSSSKLNYFESFLVRRLHTDKIPISELKTCIKAFRSSILESIESAKVLNLFLTNINNDIVIKDHNAHSLSVSSLKSDKEIEIAQGDDIIVKCIADKGVKYYKFERRSYKKVEFLGLYSAKLEVIRPPSRK
ncbi:hypothetical protein N9528_02320 [Crocinitomicaceae bacterium]|nr:hypothetical protein [Crocinitomicaceae bacterium]